MRTHPTGNLVLRACIFTTLLQWTSAEEDRQEGAGAKSASPPTLGSSVITPTVASERWKEGFKHVTSWAAWHMSAIQGLRRRRREKVPGRPELHGETLPVSLPSRREDFIFRCSYNRTLRRNFRVRTGSLHCVVCVYLSNLCEVELTDVDIHPGIQARTFV